MMNRGPAYQGQPRQSPYSTLGRPLPPHTQNERPVGLTPAIQPSESTPLSGWNDRQDMDEYNEMEEEEEEYFEDDEQEEEGDEDGHDYSAAIDYNSRYATGARSQNNQDEYGDEEGEDVDDVTNLRDDHNNARVAQQDQPRALSTFIPASSHPVRNTMSHTSNQASVQHPLDNASLSQAVRGSSTNTFHSSRSASAVATTLQFPSQVQPVPRSVIPSAPPATSSISNNNHTANISKGPLIASVPVTSSSSGSYASTLASVQTAATVATTATLASSHIPGHVSAYTSTPNDHLQSGVVLPVPAVMTINPPASRTTSLAQQADPEETSLYIHIRDLRSLVRQLPQMMNVQQDNLHRSHIQYLNSATQHRQVLQQSLIHELKLHAESQTEQLHMQLQVRDEAIHHLHETMNATLMTVQNMQQQLQHQNEKIQRMQLLLDRLDVRTSTMTAATNRVTTASPLPPPLQPLQSLPQRTQQFTQSSLNNFQVRGTARAPAPSHARVISSNSVSVGSAPASSSLTQSTFAHPPMMESLYTEHGPGQPSVMASGPSVSGWDAPSVDVTSTVYSAKLNSPDHLYSNTQRLHVDETEPFDVHQADVTRLSPPPHPRSSRTSFNIMPDEAVDSNQDVSVSCESLEKDEIPSQPIMSSSAGAASLSVGATTLTTQSQREVQLNVLSYPTIVVDPLADAGKAESDNSNRLPVTQTSSSIPD